MGLVGHSFGGLLLRQGIALTPEVTVRHLIMLGTPNRPPYLARVMYPYLPQRIHVGTCRACLVDDTWFQRLPALRVPYTVVAGTAGWRGSLSPFKGKGNDGLVQVSETLVKDDDHPFLVPTIHSLLMNNARVHRLIIEKFEPV